MKKIIVAIVLLMALFAAATPPIATPNYTNIERQLRVFSDGGTFSVFLKDGTNPANKRGICFNDNGTSTVCDAGIAYDPNTASFSMTAAVIADYYRAQYVPYLSTSGPWQDGGSYALGGFNCGRPPGLTGDGLWEHGVPCITDYTGPMEITANYPDIYYDGDDICTVEITTPPNNPRAAGCNLTVMNGPQKNFWVRHDGSVWTLGNINFHQSGAHVIYVDQAPGYIELKGNIASNLGFTYASIYTDNVSTLSANSYIQSWYNGGQPQAAVDYGGAFEAHVSEATVAWDHAAAFSQYGKVGDYPAAFGASTGKEYGHKLDCPAMTDGGAGTIAYFEDAGWATCNRTGWHVIGEGPIYSGTAPITVSGSNISCDMATGSVPGCISTSTQTFGGAKSFNDTISLSGATSWNGGTVSTLSQNGIALGGGFITTLFDGQGISLENLRASTDPGAGLNVTSVHYRDAGSYFAVLSGGACYAQPLLTVQSNGDLVYQAAPDNTCSQSPNVLEQGILTDGTTASGHVSMQSADGLYLTLRGRLTNRRDAWESDGGRPSYDGGYWIRTEPDGGAYYTYAGLHGAITIVQQQSAFGGWMFQIDNPNSDGGPAFGGPNKFHIDSWGAFGGDGMPRASFPACPAWLQQTSLGQFYYGVSPSGLLWASDEEKWYRCASTGWAELGGTGGSVTGSSPIVVTGGTAISVINAGTNDAGVVNVGVQNFGGPKAIVFDGGSDAYALYLMKGQDMSGGTQSIGICFGGTLSDTTGVACSDPTSRQQYITAGSDTYLHILSSFRNDVSGTFTWSGAINSNGTYNTSVSSGQAFASSGTNSYSILGLSTTGGLVASSGTTNGGVTYNLDAGRLMTNTGASWRGVAYADELPASYTGSAPISVAGTVISVAAGTVSASGVTSVGDQKMTGPKAIYFDGGFALPDGGSRGANATVFPLLVSRGAASNGISSSGSAVGICLAQDATEADVTGTSCSSHYILSQGDGFMHFKSAVTNDSNGDLAWNGPIYNNNYIQSNVAGATSPSFNAIGTNAYSIPGKSTIAGLPSSSGTTTGGITFVTDAGRPYYNQGTGWYPIAGLNDLKTHEYIWTTACNSAAGVSCAQADVNWNPGYIPPNGDVTVGSITCGWEVNGVNSGSSPAVVEIYKTSGTPGTVCTCSFGSSSCDDGPNTPVTCNGCAANTLTNGETYVMRWNSSTTCTTKPTVMYCTVSLTNVPY